MIDMMSMTIHPWQVEGFLIGVTRKRVNELYPGFFVWATDGTCKREEEKHF